MYSRVSVRVSSDCCIIAQIIKFFCDGITCIPGFVYVYLRTAVSELQISSFSVISLHVLQGSRYVYLPTAVSELKLSSFSVIALHVFQGSCTCIFRLLYQSSNYQVFFCNSIIYLRNKETQQTKI